MGHIGGDDFVVLVPPEDVEPVSREVFARFAELAPTLYDPQDAARGSIDAVDRQGRSERFPLLTISIGVASSAVRGFTHWAEAVAIVTEMKALAKRTVGSRMEVDRRSGDPGSGPRHAPRLGPESADGLHLRG